MTRTPNPTRTLIPEDGEYETTPSDIEIGAFAIPLRSSGFGHVQSEEAAALIVRFCQQRKKDWQPFTLLELHDWGCKNGTDCHNRDMQWHIFCFRRLVEQGYIVPQLNKTFALTVEFVDICKRAADRNTPKQS